MPGRADIAVAADVYAYLGELSGAFALAASLVESDGLFAFTAEAHDGPEDFFLQQSMRYAHSEAYLRRTLAAAGFAVLSIGRNFLRMDGAVRVEAYFVVARKTGVSTGLPQEGAVNAEENGNIALGGDAIRH